MSEKINQPKNVPNNITEVATIVVENSQATAPSEEVSIVSNHKRPLKNMSLKKKLLNLKQQFPNGKQMLLLMKTVPRSKGKEKTPKTVLRQVCRVCSVCESFFRSEIVL